MPTPPAVPDEGWTPVAPFPHVDGTFLVAAGDDDDRTRVAYFRGPDAGRLYARVWFGGRTLGPPGHVHGGAIAAALDEAMGAACWMLGHPAVAAQITITFHDMLPVNTDTRVESWIEHLEGRKVRLRATMTTPEGARVAGGEGLFVVLRDEVLRSLSGLSGD